VQREIESAFIAKSGNWDEQIRLLRNKGRTHQAIGLIGAHLSDQLARLGLVLATGGKCSA
jgi:hypothetical protein